MWASEVLDLACRKQAQSYDRPTTAFGPRCNKAVFEAAKHAAAEAYSKTEDFSVHVVPAGTGSGKTTFSTSLIATMVDRDPAYSAAYVVATISEAQTVYDNLSKMLPPDVIGIYTSAHRSLQKAIEHSPEVEEHVERLGSSSPGGLSNARISICTHEHWLLEGDNGDDLGVRQWNGKPRTNVFLDEFPSSITVELITPSDIDELADELDRVPEMKATRDLLREIAGKLRAIDASKSGTHGIANLMNKHERECIRSLDLSSIRDARDSSRIQTTKKVLDAIKSPHSFYYRERINNITNTHGRRYLCHAHDRFQPHPGLIILDATANLAPQANNRELYRFYQVPGVDYRHLSITHIQQPSGFENISSRAASSDAIAQYAAWMKKLVKNMTTSEDRVLIVLPKKVAEALATESPVKGRNVLVATWGMGIGSNQYRDCNVTFLFSEFHLPRLVHLSESIAVGADRVSDLVRQAQGAKATKAVKDRSEAHRMRHFKQMAARGCIRNIDEEGVAAPMRLYTTMESRLLFDRYEALFPGAPLPNQVVCDASSLNTKPKRLAALMRQCMKTKHSFELDADTIQKETGIVAKSLKKAFASQQCNVFTPFGWTFVPGKARQTKPSLRYDPSASIAQQFSRAA